ncbi:hypothetical protein BDV25DRAFT_148131 [Aspergillus avenaceus]|uniref:Uncharacterized protein n=1 Tax=Aspergillus avenaceus TaxID=36643 RepID=A0A5N6U6P0_ASPAV|nr:hypothetical protein BDV25DRAFT_148131 [Aspergillus avenaceus]
MHAIVLLFLRPRLSYLPSLFAFFATTLLSTISLFVTCNESFPETRQYKLAL